MQLVGDGEIEPAPHIAARELDRRHTLNSAAVGLPQSRVPRRSVLWPSQHLRELHLVSEIEIGQLLPFGIEDGSTSVGIDDTAQVRSRLRFEKDVLPEVAELALVLAGDEEGRRRALLAPLLAAHPPQIGQRQPHPLIDNSTLAQLDLADAVRLSRVASVAQILDQKGAGARYGHQYLSRPLVRNVRGAHHQRRRGPPIGENVNCAQRHVSLARAALGYDPRRFGFAQVLCRPSNRQCLRRKRLAQHGRNARRYRVLCALQRREGIENTI